MNVQPMIGLAEGLVNLFDGRFRHVSLLVQDHGDVQFFDYRDKGFNDAPDPGAVFSSVVMWEVEPAEMKATTDLLSDLHAHEMNFTFTKHPDRPCTLKDRFETACHGETADNPLAISCVSLTGLILQKLAIEPPQHPAGELYRTRHVRDMAVTLAPQADVWNVRRNGTSPARAFALRSMDWMPYGVLQARVAETAALPAYQAA